MNDELRAALDKLDAALAEARAAMEPEPPCDDLRAAFARIDWALQDARAAMEPEPEPATEPEPPSVTLHDPHTGNPYRYARIDTMHTVSDGTTALTGWWAGNDAAWNTCDVISHVVAESPAAIRAACAEKGVPCVAEEKPKTVTVDTTPIVWLVVREPVPVVQRMIDACREGE